MRQVQLRQPELRDTLTICSIGAQSYPDWPSALGPETAHGTAESVTELRRRVDNALPDGVIYMVDVTTRTSRFSPGFVHYTVVRPYVWEVVVATASRFTIRPPGDLISVILTTAYRDLHAHRIEFYVPGFRTGIVRLLSETEGIEHEGTQRSAVWHEHRWQDVEMFAAVWRRDP